MGIETERLAAYLSAQSRQHGERYEDDIPAYLFALHTYIAAVAKIVAAMALPNAAQDIADPTTPLEQRVRALESGRLFLMPALPTCSPVTFSLGMRTMRRGET